MVKYAILGPVELRDGERRIGVGGPRQVALLALLLVHANRALSSDRLIDALWDDLGRAGALKRLQVTIARLRRTLDPDGVQGESVLRTVGGGYLLAVRPGDLDAGVFQARMDDGRRWPHQKLGIKALADKTRPLRLAAEAAATPAAVPRPA